MKKIISLVLAAFIFSATVLSVSCAQETEVFDLDLTAELALDLSEVTFRWGTAWLTQFYPSEGFSSAGDKMRAHYRKIEEELGCKIEFISWQDGGSRVMEQVAAGMQTLDVIDSHATNAGIELYRAGILAPLEDVPNINGYDEKYGPLRFRQYGIFDGKLYGLYQYNWDFPPEFACAMMFNTDMLNSFGLVLPYEYQEMGRWTWDEYEKMLFSVADAAKNSGYDKHFAPNVANMPERDAIGFMLVNGCQVIEKDANGNYIFGLDNQKGIDALEYLQRLCNEKLYVVGDVNVFIKDRNAAFLTTESYYATHFNENNETGYLPGNDFTYGFINYPHGPSGDENCVSAFVHKGRRMNWVIKYSGNELSDIGIFLDRMFEPIDDEGGWRTSLERYVFYDQRDFDNYSFMLEHINFRHDLDLGENATSKMDDAFSKAITNSRSCSEAFNSIRTVINEAISANVNWVFEDIVAQ